MDTAIFEGIFMKLQYFFIFPVMLFALDFDMDSYYNDFRLIGGQRHTTISF
jgi:hypothetical protein